MAHAGPTGDAGREEVVELMRSGDRLHGSVEWVSGEQVRCSKRVVTETRTITVRLRREELVVERYPIGEQDAVEADSPAQDGAGPVAEIVLHEEVPEVTLRTVPTEWVLVYKNVEEEPVPAAG